MSASTSFRVRTEFATSKESQQWAAGIPGLMKVLADDPECVIIRVERAVAESVRSMLHADDNVTNFQELA